MFDNFYKLKNVRAGAGDSLVGDVYENVHGWDVKIGEVQLEPAGTGYFTPVDKPYIRYPISYSRDPAGNIHINFTSLTPAQPKIPRIMDDVGKISIIDEIIKDPFKDIDPFRNILQDNPLDKKKLFRL